jgi:hypothetical protein
MSTTDSFLPDPERRTSGAEQRLEREAEGDGPDVFIPDAAEAEQPPEEPESLRPNPLFRTPQPGERLTADELERDIEN